MRGLLSVALLENVEVQDAPTLEDGLVQLRQQLPGCLLLDSSLHDCPTDKALANIAQAGEDIRPCPVVVLDCLEDSSDAAEVLSAGAQDRVAKQWLTPNLSIKTLRYTLNTV